MNEAYRLDTGEVPLLVSMPHCGTALTLAVEAGLNDAARSLDDTDWHIPELYDFVAELGASRLQAHYSRYVVDLNRPEDDTPLYAGATTGLFPDIDFDGRPLFAEGRAPSRTDRDWALEHVWRPYHQALAGELARLKQRFGYALLFDAHSIRSRIPRLFDDRLPDLNLGTYEDRSCDPALSRRLQAVCQAQSRYTHVANGRFKGGHITRHYNDPQHDVHGVQLELSQRTYMQEAPPFAFDEARADAVRPLLRTLLAEMLAWGEARYGRRG
ncbi:N-formylglutamate deformylase [Halomonas sp. HP20-15]|uniref:N-formylglutamate deformylase n=1 Tax=Halomonas sp. HP20-15 TaxID=3085901 RepID=UPI0029816732|nr:N-formylglutamate deformylase [Halomonas sp. HP20-15]MDW5375776.1 N-formylglutamate deformylase [Halomonas sp. HP20-15]